LIAITSPTVARLIDYESKRPALTSVLRYRDKKIDFELRRLTSNPWAVKRLGEEEFRRQVDELRKKRDKSLLFEDKDGMWTYAGMAHTLAARFGDRIETRFASPNSGAFPWNKKPADDDRPYQTSAARRLLSARHAAVEIGTGLGKSRIIRNLLKELALRAIVMAPSLSIAGQLYRDFVTHFGKARVGRFFDGHKEPQKMIVVGVGASLTRVAPGSLVWDQLSSARAFFADESHMCPASTLEKVCHGLAAGAEYRFFFSGTQMRNDGLDLLLQAITGPIVFRMTVRDGVDQKYLTKPLFRMLWMDSDVDCSSSDAMVLTRRHVYGNPRVALAAATFANKAVSLMDRPTLILVDEMEQFARLLPHLKHEVRFAHGGVTGKNREKIPSAFHDSDTEKLVDAFNARKFPILVGTSCVSTGTDLCAPGCIVYLRGGKSEIEVRQGVGRGTRLFPGKTDCVFVDIGIANVPTLERHAKARVKIYKSIYPSYEETRI